MLPRIVAVGLFLAGFAHAEAPAATPWERYLAVPSPEHARRVVALEYSTDGSADRPFERQDEDLALLSVQVLSGDREAVDLAFRLLQHSDGHGAETLDIMLGRLIRVRPRLFLQALMVVRPHLSRLDGVVGNFGGEYVDRFDAQKYEARQRIRALRGVSDPVLQALRDECIAHLVRVVETPSERQ